MATNTKRLHAETSTYGWQVDKNGKNHKDSARMRTPTLKGRDTNGKNRMEQEATEPSRY